ncbi:MAG: primosomal protein N' [Clostridiales bacterium]|nr:primosomal protein N' [Clostridiales bacterium]HBM81747.1 primosomal protein N' [Clostridiaceae bacterium]
MPKYAEVAVDCFINDPKGFGTFDYVIPEKMNDELKTGMRVVVPFAGRAKEGYIINIKDRSSVDLCKLKEVNYIPQFNDIFNERQLMLAKWMSRKYICPIIECLKCILPHEASMKEKKYVKLKDNVDIESLSLNSNEAEIVKSIKEKGGRILFDLLDDRQKRLVGKLQSAGIVALESIMKEGLKEKYIKGIRLKVKDPELSLLLHEMQKSKRVKLQVDLINLLNRLNKTVPERELTDGYKVSSSTINTLVRKGIADKVDIPVRRNPYDDSMFSKNAYPVLTDDQRNVINRILGEYYNHVSRNFLIHGVTGSGKTEVYMRLVEDIIKNGKQAIVLVPEISLTPQTIERFKGRFEKVAIIHSRLSAGEKYDEWKRIKQGKVDVVVGARSAVFAPFDNLGIIIIDEEQEDSYKSDMTPKYNAREIAYKRCEIENAMLVLGSATPSIDTFYDAQHGKYVICRMPKRVDNKKLPVIEVVDMRLEVESGNKTIFSRKLFREMKNSLHNGQQIILFLNRRGYSTFVSCRKCGMVIKCPRCDVSLTYHIDRNILNCHYCGYSMRPPDICPSCKSRYIKYFGIGTQKVESEVKKYFPEARVLRMDFDTTTKKGSHDRLYRAFKNREADILIGTQMVSKGLDFPGVSLVGIIAADLTLNIPDYRSSERSFTLITQVAGRAGRGEDPGKVIVQTYNPEHYSIVAAVNKDFIGFYNKEIKIRKALNYPPFSELINIVASSKNEKDAALMIKKIAYTIYEKFGMDEKRFVILGPSSAPISRINMYYRWQIILKGTFDDELKKQIKLIVNNFAMRTNSIRINIDIDPVSLT